MGEPHTTYPAGQKDLAFLGFDSGRGLIRIHCGLEGTSNLLADLDNAMRKL